MRWFGGGLRRRRRGCRSRWCGVVSWWRLGGGRARRGGGRGVRDEMGVVARGGGVVGCDGGR